MIRVQMRKLISFLRFFFSFRRGYLSRSIASTLFASPPQSTYEEALQYFTKAEQTKPGFFKKNTAYLALVNARLGNTEAVQQWKAKTLEKETLDADDREADEIVKKL